MTRKCVYDKVKELIEEYCHGTTVNTTDDELWELGYDSLSVLELGRGIQDFFGFDDDLDISKYSTAGQIADEVWAIINA